MDSIEGGALPVACPQCTQLNRATASFCGACGAGLSHDRPCPACGSRNPHSHRFCDMCGVGLLAGGAGSGQEFAQSHPRPSPAQAAGYTAKAVQSSSDARISGLDAQPAVVAGPGLAAYAAGLAVALAAIAARVYRLDSLPADLVGLEDAFASAALRVAQGGLTVPDLDAVAAQPVGFAYMLGAWTLLFGESVTALRLLPAMVGLASVGVFYLLARRLLGARAALLGAAVLAPSLWAVQYSRLLLPASLMLLAALAVAYLLSAALDEERADRRRMLGLAGGLVLGATPYIDNSFLILLGAVGMFWLIGYMAEWDSSGSVGAVAYPFWLAAAAMAVPFVILAAMNLDAVVEQARAASALGAPEYQELDGLTEQTKRLAAGVWNTAIRLLFGSFVGADRLLDVGTALLALVGLAVSAARWRERAHGLLLAFFGVGVVAAGLTTEAGMFGRLTVALPAVFGAAGFGLHWLMTWMKGRAPEPVAYGFAAALIALITYANLNAYFGQGAALP